MISAKPFIPSRLAAAIKLFALVPLSLAANQALALNLLPGQELTIDSSQLNDRYVLPLNSKLTANGALMVSVFAQNATFEMNGGRILNSSETGVTLYGSTATIRDAVITADNHTGMIVGTLNSVVPSTAEVTNTQITGGTQGVLLNGASRLTLNGSQVTGGQQGILALDGTLVANQSRITGATNGIEIYRPTTAPKDASYTFDNSAVVGESGAAIVVQSAGTVEIDVNNGSTLEGGNGNMLELNNTAAANMRVNNSALTGNIQVGTGSNLDLNLDGASMTGDVNNGGTAHVGMNNGSVFTGRLDTVDTVAINSGSTWMLIDNQSAKDLSLNGGNVKFGEPGTFYQLDVANLSGNGTFIMSADFSTLKGDFLNVTGTSSGSHQLLIASSGADPLSEDRLHVVHTEDGGAQFSLVGDRVDVGTYSYSLIEENTGKDWLLDPSSKVISPSTNSVLALANAAPSVLYGEMTSLRTRMGELRHSDGKSSGLWSRGYGNKFEVSNDNGAQYDQTQRGFTIGADVPLDAGDGQWLAGVLAGHSTSDLDLHRGSNATVKSYYVGGYATWLDAESGFYFDGVLKFNRLHNESKVAMSDGKKAKGNYQQNAVSASAEVGRHIKLDDGYFVEPYGQVAAAIIQDQSYDLDNGLDAKGSRTASVVGKAGVTVGRDIQLDSGGVLQPYLRTAVAHEFNQSNKVSVNDNRFNNDLSGTRVEVAAGLAMAVSKNWKVHADVEHSQGKNIDQPWGVNVGVRYDF